MFERIVAAIDSDPERGATVEAAAQELAQQFGSRVLVGRVREVERAATTVGMVRPSALPPVLHVESEEEARALVDAAVDRLHNAGVQAEGQVGHGAAGSTARELLAIAQSYGATLIVVGDRGARASDVLLGGVDPAVRAMRSPLRDLPPRLATGASIRHAGLEKWYGSDKRAERVHGAAAGAFPFLGGAAVSRIRTRRTALRRDADKWSAELATNLEAARSLLGEAGDALYETYRPEHDLHKAEPALIQEPRQFRWQEGRSP